jgi:N-acetylmuramoyl-L-alanine amidase
VQRPHSLRTSVFLTALSALCLVAPGAINARQNTNATYTILSSAGRRSLPVKTADPADLVAVDQLVPIFGLTLKEDALAGGLSITAGRQTIVLTPNQPLASIAGRLVSLSAPVVKDGSAWMAPLDLLSRVIGPALGSRVDVRRRSRLILIGDLRVPQLSVHLERQAAVARIVVDIEPAAAYKLTRETSRLTARFTADGLDLAPVSGIPADLASGVRTEGTALVIDLGPAAPGARATEDSTGTRLIIEFGAPAMAGPSLAALSAGRSTQDAASLLAPQTAGLHTIVIDAGHGGSDSGVRGADDLVEKNLTIAVAKRLKARIEERLGLRVVLTRDNDDDVDVDKRAAVANNNKADLLISLHVNASLRPAARGAQIYVINQSDYADHMPGGLGTGVQVPIMGGGTRAIDPLPWGYAQLAHADASIAFAAIVLKRLQDSGVTLHDPSLPVAPLRLLAGVNMPAVLIEMGFLTNADDAQALASDATQNAIADALLAAITEVRAGIPSTAGGGGQ